MKKWTECKSSDFAKLSKDEISRTVAVLPIGATEQHGPHLPLGVDSYITDAILKETTDKDALVLPMLPIGFSPEHQSYGGTLTLSATTALSLWRDIAHSIAEVGIRKLLLFSAHGGHTAIMDVCARELRSDLAMMVFSCNWENLVPKTLLQNLFNEQELRYGAHAGAIETSVMLALRPDLVDLNKAEIFGSSKESWTNKFEKHGKPELANAAKRAWAIEDYNLQGALGDATSQSASAEKGAALISAAANNLSVILRVISEEGDDHEGVTINS